MRSPKLVFILSIAALSCFLFGYAQTASTVQPAAASEKKTIIRIGSPFKAGHILVEAAEKFKELVEQGSGGRIDVQIDAGAKSEEWANNKIKTGESAILVDLQRKGMQVVIPNAESFRPKAKPAVDELFKTQWSVTTWAEVLAQ
ncbi:MAG: hypothetical protein JW836_00870 [Deltaproteobacteria bacterium]|nr:hypothetical protein [Deltaproteobacteria bacterium]